MKQVEMQYMFYKCKWKSEKENKTEMSQKDCKFKNMSKKSEKKNLLKNEKIGFLWKFFWLQFEIYMKLLIPITQRLYVDLCFGG